MLPFVAHTSTIEQVIQEVHSSLHGISSQDASARIQQFGKNKLVDKHKKSAFSLFIQQFKDFMILILIAAAVISGFAGDTTDTVIILIIVLLNACIGFVQEYRAEKAMEALNKLAVTYANVLRDGIVVQVLSEDLVPGDLVLLEAGMVVPADMRIIESFALRVEEASLTGESLAVDKSTVALVDDETPLGDRINMLYKGTLISAGRGKAIVVATGMDTELGKIAHMLQLKEVATPLQQRMTAFGKKLSYIILFICLVLFVSGWLRGEDPATLLLLSISLAVAAIPEALPALITIALSRGASRLSNQQVLIRKLPAVETLGSVSFICTDKTGTLTLNKMKVVDDKEILRASFESNISLFQAAQLLNQDVSWSEQEGMKGEATELALVQHVSAEYTQVWFDKFLQTYPRVSEIPFDSDRKCMTTVHAVQDRFLVITKGADESVAALLHNAEERSLLKELALNWAKEGKRVITYAYKWLDKTEVNQTDLESQLHLLGLVALMDPPRPEVKEAIAHCKRAGITPVMITGDHPATAAAIATEIGLLTEGGIVMTGKELTNMDSEAYLNQVERTVVYARVSPEQKLQIVQSLQNKGHYVAMTGDGVNDAPSLKASNIGVAMGINGTDVSKEAAHMVLLDDAFTSILLAVKEGRRIFDNIRKFVKYIMTCNGAEIWTIAIAPLLGLPMPLLPIHILWINLVTDGLPALALANERAEKNVMQRPPRPASQSIFADGIGYHIIWVGILMAAVTLFTQYFHYSKDSNLPWQTMVFTVLSLSQLTHVMAIRSDRRFLFQQGLFSNTSLFIIVMLTFGLQMMVIYVPFFNTIFKTQPLTMEQLFFCIGMAMIVFHAVEAEKWMKQIFVKK
ncbi:MAG: cation-translocating P-type ATPase [Hydrotalea sp.]|nr:cation-translocating P-type ATPase [Hydrotalea sp.]